MGQRYPNRDRDQEKATYAHRQKTRAVKGPPPGSIYEGFKVVGYTAISGAFRTYRLLAEIKKKHGFTGEMVSLCKLGFLKSTGADEGFWVEKHKVDFGTKEEASDELDL